MNELLVGVVSGAVGAIVGSTCMYLYTAKSRKDAVKAGKTEIWTESAALEDEIRDSIEKNTLASAYSVHGDPKSTVPIIEIRNDTDVEIIVREVAFVSENEEMTLRLGCDPDILLSGTIPPKHDEGSAYALRPRTAGVWKSRVGGLMSLLPPLTVDDGRFRVTFEYTSPVGTQRVSCAHLSNEVTEQFNGAQSSANAACRTPPPGN